MSRLHMIIKTTFVYWNFAGVYTLDQVLLVFYSTGMLVGGVTAFFLDNTIPGW